MENKTKETEISYSLLIEILDIYCIFMCWLLLAVLLKSNKYENRIKIADNDCGYE